MLRSISDLKRVTIAATDGELGRVRDLYFDDLSWAVRYFVVDTGRWLPDRWVFVPPKSVRPWDADPSILRVGLTKTQLKIGLEVNTQLSVVGRVVKGHAPECDEPHLQAATAVMGYTLETEDGEIGHVEDLLVDDAAWVTRYLRVDTKNKWAGQSVLVAPEWLAGATWGDSKRFFCIVTALDDRPASRGVTGVRRS